MKGLSPRVRGNRRRVREAHWTARSIPACAGEPPESPAHLVLRKVYPRVCGGTLLAIAGVGAFHGLSPRVRGNPFATRIARSKAGSIPACAGEPWLCWVAMGLNPVYPRVCGGTLTDDERSYDSQGLSPRVRGNRRGGGDDDAVQRSIPACAGEPSSESPSYAAERVYPRVCGGTIRWAALQGSPAGLSPRVRGNRRERWERVKQLRSIPACAGEPQRRRQSTPRRGVYPRVCGGTLNVPEGGQLVEGLSPRVRGNLQAWGCVIAPPGSIPACAGEPQGQPPCPAPPGVYPRVCGGTWLTS